MMALNGCLKVSCRRVREIGRPRALPSACVRRRAGLPDAIVAVVEDAVAVALGSRTLRIA
jgi:hypothetical protein